MLLFLSEMQMKCSAKQFICLAQTSHVILFRVCFLRQQLWRNRADNLVMLRIFFIISSLLFIKLETYCFHGP